MNKKRTIYIALGFLVLMACSLNLNREFTRGKRGLACIGDTTPAPTSLEAFSIDSGLIQRIMQPEIEHAQKYAANPTYKKYYDMLEAAEFRSYWSDFTIRQAYGLKGPVFPTLAPIQVPDFNNMPSVMAYHSAFANQLSTANLWGPNLNTGSNYIASVLPQAPMQMGPSILPRDQTAPAMANAPTVGNSIRAFF